MVSFFFSWSHRNFSYSHATVVRVRIIIMIEKSSSSSTRSFLYPPLISSLSAMNILLSTLFQSTIYMFASIRSTKQQPKLQFLYIAIVTFLDSTADIKRFWRIQFFWFVMLCSKVIDSRRFGGDVWKKSSIINFNYSEDLNPHFTVGTLNHVHRINK